MESFNVVVTVSTTVCIDAENPDDAIEKVSQALNNCLSHCRSFCS